MTKINKKNRNKIMGANKKLLRDRVNQIIRQGIDRAAEQNDHFLNRTNGILGDGRVYSAVFFNCAV